MQVCEHGKIKKKEYWGYNKGCHKPQNQGEEEFIINSRLQGYLYLACKIRDQAFIDHEQWKEDCVKDRGRKYTDKKIKDYYQDPLEIYETSLINKLLNMVQTALLIDKQHKTPRNFIPFAKTEDSPRDEVALFFKCLRWPYFKYSKKYKVGEK